MHKNISHANTHAQYLPELMGTQNCFNLFNIVSINFGIVHALLIIIYRIIKCIHLYNSLVLYYYA